MVTCPIFITKLGSFICLTEGFSIVENNLFFPPNFNQIKEVWYKHKTGNNVTYIPYRFGVNEAGGKDG